MERIDYDLAIVGGGILGLATAHAVRARRPEARIVVLEKEPALARHQTGRNSGVVHSGIYYAPGSLKARLCVEGARRLEAFCRERGVRYEAVGKVIVATREEELPRLDALLERGRANGVPGLRRLDPAGLREVEPHAAGLAAIHSPATAIVDYVGVAEALAAELRAGGARVETGAPVVAIDRTGDGHRLRTPRLEVRARAFVACAGLHADRVARLAGTVPSVRIVPFRGEYYQLAPERRNLVRGNVYPVPDPALPFLGVHLTRTVDGGVEAGPNAVFAFAREGYRMRDVHAGELVEALAFPGTWRLAARFWRTGVYEFRRSLDPELFVRSLRRLVPELRREDVRRGGAGVRAQAIDRAGRLVDDFVIERAPGALHVLNAPSPAATASLAIGRRLAEEAEPLLDGATA